MISEMLCLSSFGTSFVSYNAFAPTMVAVKRKNKIDMAIAKFLFFTSRIPPFLITKATLCFINYFLDFNCGKETLWLGRAITPSFKTTNFIKFITNKMKSHTFRFSRPTNRLPILQERPLQTIILPMNAQRSLLYPLLRLYPQLLLPSFHRLT